MDEQHQHEDVVADLTDLQATLRGDDPTIVHGATIHELAWFRQALAAERPTTDRDADPDREATVTPLPRRSDDLAARIWRPRAPFEEAIQRLRLAERVSTPDPNSLAEGGRAAARKAAELQQLANRRLRRET
jgi:hypothetical protein